MCGVFFGGGGVGMVFGAGVRMGEGRIHHRFNDSCRYKTFTYYFNADDPTFLPLLKCRITQTFIYLLRYILYIMRVVNQEKVIKCVLALQSM